MSYKEYIEKKRHTAIVHYEISELKNIIREYCLGLKNKKQLYDYFLDLRDISKELDYVNYPNKYKLLMHLNSPNKDSNILENFYVWSSKYSDSRIKILEEKISYLKSLFYLSEDVSINDIEYVVDSKCKSILEKFKILDIFINESIQDTKWSGNHVVVKILSDNSANIMIENDILVIEMNQNKPKLLSSSSVNYNEDYNILLSNIFLPKNKYYTFYILENLENTQKLNYFKRKFYLSKFDEYFDYPLHFVKPIPTEKMQLWETKLKLEQVIYKNDAFRLLDAKQSVRYLEVCDENK